MTELQGLDEKISNLYDAYNAISKKYERLIDEVKTINHGGKYVLKTVYNDGKEYIQKFNSMHDAFAEMQDMAKTYIGQFKFILKYEVKK